MNRKLLPYERGLCEQLGVTEDEYLLFLAAQRDYALSEGQRRETLRGDPVSITLAVVGILFQVASMLLAPKPPQQPKAENLVQRRDRRYAPRFGFNSTQELANYGEAINLVYCNQTINPKGAVRVNTSLLWSSVESTGTGQYMQLLLLVGAAGVRKLDYAKTAFGQLPARQFGASNTWMYYAEQNGPVRFSNKVWGDNRDPAMNGAGSGDIVHRVRQGSELRESYSEGYSMAFTPTTMKDLGVYNAIPINVLVFERNTDGKLKSHNIGIHVAGGTWHGGHYTVGERITIRFNEVQRKIQDNVAAEAAKELRLQMVNYMDRGSTYQLGSANFKLNWVEDDISLTSGPVRAELECTESGFRPTTNYGLEKPKNYDETDREEWDRYEAILEAPVDEKVLDLSTTDVQKAGVTSVQLSQHTFWLGLTPGQAEARKKKSTLWDDDMRISGFGRTYDFAGTVTINWQNDLDQWSKATYHEGGSIAYTEKILEDFLADKPKILTKLLRKEYRSDLKKLRRIRDSIKAGAARKAIRNYIIATNPTAANLRNQIKIYGDLISNDAQELQREWTAQARAHPTAQDLRNRIDQKRDEFEALSDADASAKRLKRVEQAIENLRDTRRDFIQDYVADRRKENKRTPEQLKQWRNDREIAREQLKELVEGLMDDTRDDLLNITRAATSAFELPGISSERFACGIECLEDKIDDLKGEWTTDQVGTSLVRGALRKLIQQKREALQWVRWVVKNWDELWADLDDSFYVKCLVKTANAAYQTVTACDRVRFNFRVRLFRRISGRQTKYGETDAPDGYKLSDNGIKRRTMFFSMLYRNLDAVDWVRVPVLFAIERGSDTDHYISLLFASTAKEKREFSFMPVVDAAAEVKENGYRKYAYIHNAGSMKTEWIGADSVSFYGRYVDIDTNSWPDLRERGPYRTNEWDMFSVHSDTQMQASFDNGPEASLVNVTEQVTCLLDAQKYKNMSLMAFHTYASNGVDDLRSISAYVLEGKASWKVADSGSGPYWSGEGASYAPDIFTDTVMDATNGIKNFANQNAIDWERLALAKRFCKNNGLGTPLFMEGVIADRRGWREFWAEVAPYSLLEFARMNGKETLIPALPCDANGVATRQLTISAIFNESNILEESYREEYLDYGDNTKDLVATVVYREVRGQEIFPRNTSVTLCRSDTDTNDAVWQTFDLSDWISQKRQAVLFGRYLCQQRRYVGRTIEFQTVPTDSPVQPGAYVFVDIGLKRWDTVRTGTVLAGGVLDLPLDVAIQDGTYTVMTYDSVREPAVHQNVVISNGVATGLNAVEGSLFVLGNSSDARRVFRITEVSLNEDAVLTVRGVEHPCSVSGASVTSLVADLSDGLFREIGVDCG